MMTRTQAAWTMTMARPVSPRATITGAPATSVITRMPAVAAAAVATDTRANGEATRRTGAPISPSIVGRAVDNALRRAGIDAPVRGGNLLRHSLGLTNPVYLAMYARRRMHLHGTTEGDLSLVKVKNSVAGSRNPNARYRYEFTSQQVNSSPIYCDPLRLLHISAISDGGAAVVLASERFARARGDRGVRLVAVRTPAPGAANGDLEMGEIRSAATGGEARSFRDSLVQDAYLASGIDARELSLAEVYDVSCASELDWYESLGLCDRGDAERLLRDGATSLGGITPVNASGGLSSLGEAPSAQVLAQLCELTWQLRGEAGARQVPMARLGIAVSQGIFGHGAAVVAMRQ